MSIVGKWDSLGIGSLVAGVSRACNFYMIVRGPASTLAGWRNLYPHSVPESARESKIEKQ